MISSKFTLKADEAMLRYKNLTDTWQVLFGRALASPEFGYAGQPSKVINEAVEIAEAYLRAETDHVAATLYEIAHKAQGLVSSKITNTDSDLLTLEAQTHLGETQSYILDEIAAQIRRDIANMRQSLQRVVLDTSIIQRTHRLKSREAVVAWRLRNDETLDFNFKDRRAHRTPSAKFVRGVWRQTMLCVHNETTLFTLAEYGQSRAGIYKVVEDQEQFVAAISLNDQGVGYNEVRSQLFHPNSNAYLGVI